MDHEAVFWDVGGVVMNVESIGEAQAAFVATLVDEYDLEATPEAALETWRDALREHFAGRDGRAYRTAREGRRKAATALFDGDPPADWRDRYAEVTRDAAELNPGVEETMAALHEAGVYQAIVSDADEGLGERLEREGLGRYLADVTTSEEVGYVKPDERIFEAAFEKARAAGVDPETGVMVGDKYDNDMEGAKAMGLTTAGYGTTDGPAVDHVLDDLGDLLAVVGVRDA